MHLTGSNPGGQPPLWGATCPEDELLAAVVALKRALHQLGEPGKTALEPGAFPVLHHLACVGPSRPGQIAAAIGLDASTISRHVRTLARRGLIESKPDRTDGRASVLSVSDRGTEFLAQHVQLRREAIARGTAGFTTAERAELVRLLQKFNQAISQTGTEHRKTQESR